MSEKRFYIDLETTGLDPKVNGVWQIGAIIKIDGQEVARFSRKMRPFPGQIVTKAALEKCGITMEQLRAFEDPVTVFRDLCDLLGKYVSKFNKQDKFFFIAYNGQFDMDFLRQWFLNNGEVYFGSWFWFPYIDVMQLAAFVLRRHRSEMINFRLDAVMEKLGLKLENAHDADFDIAATEQILSHFEVNGLAVMA